MKPEDKKHALTVYIPDTRGVTVSRFGRGNAKIGTSPGIYTYSRLPGHPANIALGHDQVRFSLSDPLLRGTCPGATAECQSICYAARPVAENGVVYDLWRRNSWKETVPETLPPDAWLVRIHVSGDFTSPEYIRGWIKLVGDNPNVKFFGYTRSWRVPELLEWLEHLRSLPNIQLFASMDSSTTELPPRGWRIAWIAGDERLRASDLKTQRNHVAMLDRVHLPDEIQFEMRLSYTCPEETKHKPDCESCRYCIDGKRGDVTFLKH